jgi:hypothetical protein
VSATAGDLARVIARGSAAASATPVLAQLPRPHMGDHRVGVLVEPLDHRVVLDAE